MRSNPGQDQYAKKIIKDNMQVDTEKINTNIVKGKGLNIPSSMYPSIIFSSILVIAFILWAFEIFPF